MNSTLSRAINSFGLVWEDQLEAMEQKLVSEVPVFLADRTLDVHSQNVSETQHVLIEGDNLHALHTLQATHRGKIDVIYIDPPYNRGGDFRYNDRLIDKDDTYRHSKWLSFMSKRLTLAKQLLANSGVLFISIDSVEQARLHLLCEQIFGEKNVVASLAVVNNLKGRSDDKHIATAHEYLIIVAADSDLLVLGGFKLDEEKKAEYKNSDDLGSWKPVGLQKTGKNSYREDRPNLYYPIYWNEKQNSLSLERASASDEEIYPKFADGREGNWRWGKETFSKKHSTELVVKRQARGPVIYVKMRDISADGSERLLKPKSIWIDPKYDSGSATQLLKKMLGGKSFDNPKPLQYISDLLSIASTKSSTVLDFFAGTGTTLHAVAQLNAEDGGRRRCILVTNNENNICLEVTQPRVKAALTGNWAAGKNVQLPGALQFYRTSFIERKKNLDRMRSDLARHTVDLITIKEGVSPLSKVNNDLNVLQSLGSTVVVITSMDPNHEEALGEAKKRVRDGDVLRAYVFTWSDSGVEDEVKKLWPGWEVEPLPADMLSALRRLQPQKEDDLFADLQEGE